MRVTAPRFLVGVALFYSSLVAITLFQKQYRFDLWIVLNASERLLSGQPMYQVENDSQEHTKPPLGTLPFVPLSLVDRYWVNRAWDGLILLSFGFLCHFWLSRANPCWPKPKWKMVVLAVALTFNSWNSELRCGQFNALSFLAVLGSVYAPGALQGPLFAWAFWMKPTQILFLPWVWHYSPSRKSLLLGALGYSLGLAVLYIALFGWTRFVSDHQEWLKAAPISVTKHVARHDNYSLPGALSWLTTSSHFSTALQGFGLLLASWLTCAIPNRWRSLSWVALIVAFFSPMGWVQNYVLITPFIFFLWNDYFTAGTGKVKLLLSLSLWALFFGFQVYNPTLQATDLGRWLIPWRPPVLGLSLALCFWLWARYGLSDRFGETHKAIRPSPGISGAT